MAIPKDDIGHDYAKAPDVNHIVSVTTRVRLNDRAHPYSKTNPSSFPDVGLWLADGDTPSGELHVIFSGGEEEIETLDVVENRTAPG